MEERLKIAIQKSGRLSDGSIQLLRDCGIRFDRGKHKLQSKSSDFPLDILFLRDDDIPKYVHEQVADVGILGLNVVQEKQPNSLVASSLGFSKCRLALAVRREDQFDNISWLEGKKIATSYPIILEKFLSEHGVRAEIEVIGGSVEIAPGIGLADAVCDIVSTGSTLLMNGLKEVMTVMQSEAVLIESGHVSGVKRQILNKLLFRISAVRQASKSKYILLNAPNESISAIVDLIPGMKSPTVLPLAEPGWSSIHSVVPEHQFWDVIDRLADLGAEGILVVPIEKMMV